MRYDLSTRIYLEQSVCRKTGFFVTLTYDDEHIPYNDMGLVAFDKVHIQRFINSLRKRFERMGYGDIRYFLTCEFGDSKDLEYYKQKYLSTSGRSHYHAILLCSQNIPLTVMRDVIHSLWKYGRSDVGRSSIKSIQYATSYALKDEEYLYKVYEKGDPCKPFRLFSRNPGLGSPAIPWLESYIYNDGDNLRTRIPVGKAQRGIPRYFRDRLDESIGADLTSLTLQWLADSQDEMADVSFQNKKPVYIDPNDKSLGIMRYDNDYSKDNAILAERKAVRRARKLRK